MDNNERVLSYNIKSALKQRDQGFALVQPLSAGWYYVILCCVRIGARKKYERELKYKKKEMRRRKDKRSNERVDWCLLLRDEWCLRNV